MASGPNIPRPVGTFPSPPAYVKGPAIVGAWHRGFDAREHGLERRSPYTGALGCVGPLYGVGLSRGFQMLNAWLYGWNDADLILRG